MDILQIENQEQVQEAIIWFWPLIALVLSALLGGIKYLSKPDKGLSLAILGMQGAGKTTFWHILTRGMVQKGQTINIEITPEVEVTINEKTRLIKQSLDIAGGDELVGTEYEQLIKEKDFVLFLFNSEIILNGNGEMSSEEYVDEVRTRLQKIKSCLGDHKKRLHLVATFADKVIKDENDEREIKLVANTIYNKIGKDFIDSFGCTLKEHLVILDMTNQKLVDTYINESLFN